MVSLSPGLIRALERTLERSGLSEDDLWYLCGDNRLKIALRKVSKWDEPLSAILTEETFERLGIIVRGPATAILNALHTEDIKTLGDLIQMTETDLLKRGHSRLGAKRMSYLKKVLDERGLHLGMKLG